MAEADTADSLDALGDGRECALVDALPDIVLVIDDEARIRRVSAAGERMLGWSRAEWVGRSVLDVVHPDDLAVAISSMGTMQGKVAGTPIEVRVQDADGGWRWLEVVGSDRHRDPAIGGLVCVAREITQRRMWEVAGGDLARFQQVVQHASSITLLLDADGVVTSVNNAFNRLLGHDPSIVIGRPLSAFATADGAPVLRHAIAQAVTANRPLAVEAPMRCFDPEAAPRPVRFELVNLIDDPVVAGIVVTGHDVSELQVARQELEHLARHDALTGLANRSLLLERMEDLIADRRPVAVIYVDLDRFKPVNDLLGHEVGDELLRRVGERLSHAVRPGDLVARVGGDEFVVVACGVTSRQDATGLGQRIEEALAEPYDLDAGPVRVGASIGIAVSDRASTVTGLLADADISMYDAKSDRRGAAPRSLDERRRTAMQRRRLADDLASGIERGEVIAFLQPIVELSTGRTVALEALARWSHPELGLLTPSSFIDLAEDAGLDRALGDAVLASACDTIAGAGAHADHLRLCVNLSVGQLSDPSLCDRLISTLARRDLALERLTVEITERATLARRPAAGSVSPEGTLHRLHGLGVELSLDDFGTGYSSLTHLRRYPLAAVKVDHSFVAGMVEHPEDRAVVSAVTGLARALGLRVVAEGVETAEQHTALCDLGCDEVQGYLIAPPMGRDDLIRWLAPSRALGEREGSQRGPGSRSWTGHA
jgi:diguanylate cyclase (GGDEF)-like protein/PAS domain S-box-containing protein